jgi:hypothetical protein
MRVQLGERGGVQSSYSNVYYGRNHFRLASELQKKGEKLKFDENSEPFIIAALPPAPTPKATHWEVIRAFSHETPNTVFFAPTAVGTRRPSFPLH